jgi:hypothetical protein
MNQHEAAAAEIAATGVNDRKRIPDGNRRIHRIAAPLQDLEADLRSQFLGAHHHAMCRLDRRQGGSVGGDRERGRKQESKKAAVMTHLLSRVCFPRQSFEPIEAFVKR